MRAALFLLLVVVAGALAGCANPFQYTMVKSAAPDPLVGQRQFVVAPVSYAPAFVIGEKNEEQYLSGETDEHKAKWQGDKQAFEAQFRASLANDAAEHGVITTAASSPFTLHADVQRIDPGGGINGGMANVQMVVSVVAADGSTVDEMVIGRTLGTGFTLRTRMQRAGEWCGRTAARFLVARTAGK